ncbi:AMP-binding protein [Pseudomonas aeruginosa]|uniref:AMP-binding protein n=1 Tax=Pseudomonas aeruginosa TaxID=287 RepID=UPI0018DEFDAC|nr:AMP-binding protein [Pseudomonas aeruginosa]QPZ62279.1 AMP-binding protein [Pseudomonas aeruginosa]HBO3954687.1 AMP-binding protein [Pseudomonas aeruginosa]
MKSNSLTEWQPSADDLATANVVELMRLLGTDDYDEFYARSIQDPDRYWRMVMQYCGIAWEQPFDAYLDDSRGPEFPNWFPGGRLNWVQSILGKADDASLAAQAAVIAESETGPARRATYAELSAMVRAFAAGLEASGLKRGDRIGLLMSNGLEATVSLLAIAYVGAVAVPLFSGFGVDAIRSRLSACSAKALIASAGFHRRGKWVDILGLIKTAREELPSIETLIVHTPEGAPGQGGDGLSWAAVAQAGVGRERPAASMAANDPFMIVYTSGTTGKPKGTVHVHGGFALKIAHDSAVHFNVKPGDVFCWPADMGWIAGALVLCSALMRGAILVCYDGAPDFPDWSRMGGLIERHRVTHFGSAPTLIRGLAAHEALSCQADFSSLKLLITAGEGIDPEHFCWFQQHFGAGRCPVINYTGGTEVSGALLSSVIIRPISPAGFNTASPGVAVCVVDNDGRDVSGEPGELAIRRPFVGMTQSFWQDDERYLESYWRTIPGLWVHGDLALRENGSYFMLGRSDDTIKLAGKRVGPAEIEEVLLEIPQISEAAAVGVKDPTKGQKLVVFLVAPGVEDGDADLLKRIVAHVEARMGKPFVPARAHFVTQLPKTRSSKVMRRVIRNLCNDLPLGDMSSLDNPAALDVIRQALQR